MATASQGEAAAADASAIGQRSTSVFISYCQVNRRHTERVRDLAERLERDGFTVVTNYKNQFESWPVFASRMLEDDMKVIIACDEHYLKYSLKQPSTQDKSGAGVYIEYTDILNKVYEEQNLAGWLLPVLFRPPGQRNNVPRNIRKFTYFTLSDNEEPWVGYADLVRRLQTVPAFIKPAQLAVSSVASTPTSHHGQATPDQMKHESDFDRRWREEGNPAMEIIQEFTARSSDYYAEFRAWDAFGSKEQPANIEDLKRVDKARRVLRDFWWDAFNWCVTGLLPADLFDKSKPWRASGDSFRLMVEPIDIANYYRLELWKQLPIGNRHYLEANNRPEYYTFLELQYEKATGAKTLAEPSTQHAEEEMETIEKSSQDV